MSKIFKPVTQVQQKVSAGTWFFISLAKNLQINFI
jgi:hypothetical protein